MNNLLNTVPFFLMSIRTPGFYFGFQNETESTLTNQVSSLKSMKIGNYWTGKYKVDIERDNEGLSLDGSANLIKVSRGTSLMESFDFAEVNNEKGELSLSTDDQKKVCVTELGPNQQISTRTCGDDPAQKFKIFFTKTPPGYLVSKEDSSLGLSLPEKENGRAMMVALEQATEIKINFEGVDAPITAFDKNSMALYVDGSHKAHGTILNYLTISNSVLFKITGKRGEYQVQAHNETGEKYCLSNYGKDVPMNFEVCNAEDQKQKFNWVDSLDKDDVIKRNNHKQLEKKHLNDDESIINRKVPVKRQRIFVYTENRGEAIVVPSGNTEVLTLGRVTEAMPFMYDPELKTLSNVTDSDLVLEHVMYSHEAMMITKNGNLSQQMQLIKEGDSYLIKNTTFCLQRLTGTHLRFGECSDAVETRWKITTPDEEKLVTKAVEMISNNLNSSGPIKFGSFLVSRSSSRSSSSEGGKIKKFLDKILGRRKKKDSPDDSHSFTEGSFNSGQNFKSSQSDSFTREKFPFPASPQLKTPRDEVLVTLANYQSKQNNNQRDDPDQGNPIEPVSLPYTSSFSSSNKSSSSIFSNIDGAKENSQNGNQGNIGAADEHTPGLDEPTTDFETSRMTGKKDLIITGLGIGLGLHSSRNFGQAITLGTPTPFCYKAAVKHLRDRIDTSYVVERDTNDNVPKLDKVNTSPNEEIIFTKMGEGYAVKNGNLCLKRESGSSLLFTTCTGATEQIWVIRDASVADSQAPKPSLSYNILKNEGCGNKSNIGPSSPFLDSNLKKMRNRRSATPPHDPNNFTQLRSKPVEEDGEGEEKNNEPPLMDTFSDLSPEAQENLGKWFSGLHMKFPDLRFGLPKGKGWNCPEFLKKLMGKFPPVDMNLPEVPDLGAYLSSLAKKFPAPSLGLPDGFTFPHLSLGLEIPKFSLPKISGPKFHLPNFSLPKGFKMPSMSSPFSSSLDDYLKALHAKLPSLGFDMPNMNLKSPEFLKALSLHFPELGFEGPNIDFGDLLKKLAVKFPPIDLGLPGSFKMPSLPSGFNLGSLPDGFNLMNLPKISWTGMPKMRSFNMPSVPSMKFPEFNLPKLSLPDGFKLPSLNGSFGPNLNDYLKALHVKFPPISLGLPEGISFNSPEFLKGLALKFPDLGFSGPDIDLGALLGKLNMKFPPFSLGLPSGFKMPSLGFGLKLSDLPDGFSLPDLPKLSWPGMPKMPDFELPNYKGLSMPTFGMPGMPDMPKFNMPGMPNFKMPTMPNFKMPGMPKFKMPGMPDMPNFKMPGMPKFKMPGMPDMPTMPNFKMPGMSDFKMPGMPDMPKFKMPGMPDMPTMPKFKMPDFKMPTMPNFKMPGVPDMPTMPNFNMPGMPKFNMPGMPNMPEFDLPDMPSMPGMPSFNMPSMPGMPRLGLPNINMPDMPSFGVPSFKMPSLGSIPDMNWPKFHMPNVSLPKGFKMPSLGGSFGMDLNNYLEKLHAKLPSFGIDMPNIDWSSPDFLKKLSLKFPELSFSGPDIDLGDFLGKLSLKFPPMSLGLPSGFKMPSLPSGLKLGDLPSGISLADLPKLTWPGMPGLPDLPKFHLPNLNLPGSFEIPGLNFGKDLESYLSALKIKLPSFGISMPDIDIGSPDFLKELSLKFPELGFSGSNFDVGDFFRKLGAKFPPMSLGLPDGFSMPSLTPGLKLGDLPSGFSIFSLPKMSWPGRLGYTTCGSDDDAEKVRLFLVALSDKEDPLSLGLPDGLVSDALDYLQALKDHLRSDLEADSGEFINKLVELFPPSSLKLHPRFSLCKLPSSFKMKSIPNYGNINTRDEFKSSDAPWDDQKFGLNRFKFPKVPKQNILSGLMSKITSALPLDSLGLPGGIIPSPSSLMNALKNKFPLKSMGIKDGMSLNPAQFLGNVLKSVTPDGLEEPQTQGKHEDEDMEKDIPEFDFDSLTTRTKILIYTANRSMGLHSPGHHSGMFFISPLTDLGAVIYDPVHNTINDFKHMDLVMDNSAQSKSPLLWRKIQNMASQKIKFERAPGGYHIKNGDECLVRLNGGLMRFMGCTGHITSIWKVSVLSQQGVKNDKLFDKLNS